MKLTRIKILFLIDALELAGTEKQVLQLAEGLNRDEFAPVIGVLDDSEYLEQLVLRTPLVKFHRQGLPLFKSIRLIRDLREHLIHEKYDIVQTHLVDAAILGSMAVRSMKLRPVLVGTRRNSYHWVTGKPWVFWLYCKTAQWSDQIIANSGKVKELCSSLEGIAFDRVQVIHNGVDVARLHGVSSERGKACLELSGRYPLIGVIGNWHPVKGLNSFLRAAELVRAQIPAAHFVLIGNGPLKYELESLAQELGIRAQVTFIEGLSDVCNVIGAFDIAVQCSLSESFSNVLVEYMVAARPIVATQVGEAASMIEHGSEGLLVPPNDHVALSKAILYLCERPSLASDMGLRASEKAITRWSWDRAMEEHQMVYRSAVARAAGRI